MPRIAHCRSLVVSVVLLPLHSEELVENLIFLSLPCWFVAAGASQVLHNDDLLLLDC